MIAPVNDPAFQSSAARHRRVGGQHVQVRLVDGRVPRRGAVGRPRRPLGAAVERRVEVLGPQLDGAGRLARRLGAQLLEHRPGEAVPVREQAGGGGVDAELGVGVAGRRDVGALRPGDVRRPVEGERRRGRQGRQGLVPGLAARLAHDAVADDPHLLVPAEEGRAEPAHRETQADLAVRPPPGRRHGVDGHPVQREAGRGEGRRRGLEAPPGTEPAVGGPGGALGVVLQPLVPGAPRRKAHRRDGALARRTALPDRVVGEPGRLADGGRAGLEHARLQAPLQRGLGLGARIAWGRGHGTTQPRPRRLRSPSAPRPCAPRGR